MCVRGVLPGLAGAIHSMLGNAHHSLGDFSNANKYHTQRLDIAKEGRPGGGGQGVRESGERARVAGGLFQGDQVPHAVAGDCQGGGRPGGGGRLTCSIHSVLSTGIGRRKQMSFTVPRTSPSSSLQAQFTTGYNLDLARLHAAILTSPPLLPAFSSRQSWGCECTFLLASPDPGPAVPHASSIVP